MPVDFPSARQPQAGIFILRRVQALRDLGHTIEIVRVVPFAPKIGAKWKRYAEIPRYEVVDGFPVHTIRAIIPPRMIGMEYLPLLVHSALKRLIDAFHPDVLHASFVIPCGQIMVRHRIPTVVTAHGGDAYAWPHLRPGLYRAAREAIREATRVTAVSDYIRQCVQQLEDREVTVILNGGDQRYFFPRDRLECRQHLALPPDRFIIGFAGNLLRAKGLLDLAKAAAGMQAINPLVLIAGEGSDRAAIEREFQQAKVDVRFLGRLDSEQVGQVFGAADVVTLPSHNEGLPNVVCEAMLSARAVVASTAGGTPEIIQDGRGILVPPRDIAGLRSAYERLAQDAELRNNLAERARTFALSHLTWPISARHYERVYFEATNARS